jgi:hypothetical protein
MTAGRIALGAVGAAAAVALSTEAALRVAESRLAPVLPWHDHLTSGKWRQLRVLRREAPVDVVLAGSSQMLTALDPTVVAPDGTRCYNAALYRGVPELMTEWLADVVLPATRPRLVVWGISILDLNDHGRFHREVCERFAASPARRLGPFALEARERSAIVRRASSLRHPRALLRSLRETPGPSEDRIEGLLGAMGKGLEYVAFDTYQLSDHKAAFIRDEIVNDFAIGGRQVDALRRGAAIVQGTGARLVLLEMPSTSEFHDMYPRRSADVDDARDLLRRTADELGVPFVATKDVPHDWFADCVHLNGRGMAAWSEELRPLVAEELGRA